MSAKKNRGKANRAKGHNAERYYAKVFKEDLGFSFCVTSRYGSRIHDDSGIDLINLPINVQIKAGRQRGMNFSKVLYDMKERVKELFPPDAKEHDLPCIVIHKKEVGPGNKRNEQDELVCMSFEDFKKIIKNGIKTAYTE